MLHNKHLIGGYYTLDTNQRKFYFSAREIRSGFYFIDSVMNIKCMIRDYIDNGFIICRW